MFMYMYMYMYMYTNIYTCIYTYIYEIMLFDTMASSVAWCEDTCGMKRFTIASFDHPCHEM